MKGSNIRQEFNYGKGLPYSFKLNQSGLPNKRITIQSKTKNVYVSQTLQNILKQNTPLGAQHNPRPE